MDEAIAKRFNEITERYQGSCISMIGEFTGAEDDGDTPSDLEFIEENDLHDAVRDIMFECDTCGWWCEAHNESAEELICEECYEDSVEEE